MLKKGILYSLSGINIDFVSDELTDARTESLEEMTQRAKALGADAVVGVKMDYEVLGAKNDMLMVTCSGTAVKLKKE